MDSTPDDILLWIDAIEDPEVQALDRADLHYLIPFDVSVFWLRKDYGVPPGINPAQRSIFFWAAFRIEFNNGGIDLFVWNYSEHVIEFANIFEYVGAIRTADLLRQLHAELPDACDNEVPTRQFSDYRQHVEGPFFEVDTLEEIEDAILAFARKHPEEFAKKS